MIFSVAGNFRGNYALESFISAFLKFTLENTEYAKLMKLSDKTLDQYVFMCSLVSKVQVNIDVINRQY